MTVDHDGKIRMDCSSPYAMARLVGAQGQVSRRLRQRSRRRPPRHRHAVGGADEPQPLPRGRDPLSAHASPAVAADAAVGKTLVSSSMIDRVVREPGPARSSRCRSASSGSSPGLFDGSCLLRRRGERRRQLPAPRRHRLDDRQGRADHGPARGRDHGAHRQGSRRALSRADRGVRHAATTLASTRRRRPSRRHACSSSRPRRSPPPASPASRSSPS